MCKLNNKMLSLDTHIMFCKVVNIAITGKNIPTFAYKFAYKRSNISGTPVTSDHHQKETKLNEFCGPCRSTTSPNFVLLANYVAC